MAPFFLPAMLRIRNSAITSRFPLPTNSDGAIIPPWWTGISSPSTIGSRIPTQFDEIVPRRCRGCGRLTRLLRAVPCLYGWRERCDDCGFRHPLLFEGRAP